MNGKLLLLLCLLPFLSYAQPIWVFQHSSFGETPKDSVRFQDSTAHFNYAETTLQKAESFGFLRNTKKWTNTDSIRTLRIDFFAALKINGIEYDEWQREQNQILKEKAKSGFPFSSIEINRISFDKENIQIESQVVKGPFLLVDSIIQKGQLKLSNGYLKHHFKLHPGNIYSENTLQDLNKRMAALDFAEFSRSSAVLFTPDGASVYLYPQKRKANKLDLLLGLNTVDGEVLLSGRADIQLVNTFKRGEKIGLKWEAPPDGAQQLKLELKLPYLWGTKFWFENQFEFYRRDSSFLNTSWVSKVKYAHDARTFAGVVYRNEASRTGLSSEGLYSNYSKQLWGIELSTDFTDVLFSPTSGGNYRFEATAGKRIDPLASEDQYRFELKGTQYFQFLPKHIIRLQTEAAAFIGDRLSLNELFRVGGMDQLRGFAEQSIFSQQYATGSLEYRFRLESTSYIKLFFDLGGVQNQTAGLDLFYGLGTGISLLLENAYVNLDIAVPKNGSQPFDFRSTIIHVGYAGRF